MDHVWSHNSRAHAMPNGREVEHVFALTVSTSGRPLTVDETMLIGTAPGLVTRSLFAVAYSGSRAIVPSRHVCGWSALPQRTLELAARLGQCMCDPERGDGLRLGLGRESQGATGGAVLHSGLRITPVAPGLIKPGSWLDSRPWRHSRWLSSVVTLHVPQRST